MPMLIINACYYSQLRPYAKATWVETYLKSEKTFAFQPSVHYNSTAKTPTPAKPIIVRPTEMLDAPPVKGVRGALLLPEPPGPAAPVGAAP